MCSQSFSILIVCGSTACACTFHQCQCLHNFTILAMAGYVHAFQQLSLTVSTGCTHSRTSPDQLPIHLFIIFHAVVVCLCAFFFGLLQQISVSFHSIVFRLLFSGFVSWGCKVWRKLFNNVSKIAWSCGGFIFFYVYISLLCVWLLKWLVNASTSNNKHYCIKRI